MRCHILLDGNSNLKFSEGTLCSNRLVSFHKIKQCYLKRIEYFVIKKRNIHQVILESKKLNEVLNILKIKSCSYFCKKS